MKGKELPEVIPIKGIHPQPDVIDQESILMREEKTGVPGGKPLESD